MAYYPSHAALAAARVRGVEFVKSFAVASSLAVNEKMHINQDKQEKNAEKA